MTTPRDNKLRMAQMVSGFQAVGITIYPREEMERHCPFDTQTYKSEKWHNSARNVWNLRNGDQDIVDAFEKLLEEIKQTQKI